MVYIACYLLLLSIYTALILFYYQGFWRLPQFQLEANYKAHTTVSVLIPARDEADNIENLLNDLNEQTFPIDLLEIIVIDDHSTDDTVTIVERFAASHKHLTIKLLRLSDTTVQQAYKKKAIEWAVHQANGHLIVTTDADCRLPKNWLCCLTAFYEKYNYKIIAAPVKYAFNPNSFIEQFQALDFISLIGITGASIHTRINNMCNGANLCYEKKAFDEVNGYKGNDHLSSGDDLFLIHKLGAKYPNGVGFIKSNEACVITYPKATWQEFLAQRLRWSSKSTSYAERSITLILLLVYFTNLLLPIGLIACFIFPVFIPYFLTSLLVKSVADVLFLYQVTDFFGQRRLLKNILQIGVVHIFYIILVGALGQVSSFEWKGRKLKK